MLPAGSVNQAIGGPSGSRVDPPVVLGEAVVALEPDPPAARLWTVASMSATGKLRIVNDAGSWVGFG